MNLSTITVRYAKALFQASEEENKLDLVEDDIEALATLFKESNEFSAFIESPTLNVSQKTNIVKTLFEGKIQALTLNFINLLIKNKRESLLKSICRNFNDFYRSKQGVQSGEFVTAQAVGDKFLQDIQKRASVIFDSEIEIVNTVDEHLIGGFKLKVGDKLVDASIKTKLSNIKRDLINS